MPIVFQTSGGEFRLGPKNRRMRLTTKKGDVDAIVETAFVAVKPSVLNVTTLPSDDDEAEGEVLEPGTYLLLKVSDE